jgi:GTP-binding protein Era
MSFKSGFISIIGRPNAGKSTLLNAFLGEKISIVSAKPQTTRNTIRGVKTDKDCQIVFIDTPGIHAARGLLNEFMVKEALAMLSDVDGILYLVEADRPVTEEDRLIIDGLKKAACPVILGVNKVDKVAKPAILPLIEEYAALVPFTEVVPLSALTGDGVDRLLAVIEALLPEGPMYFPSDEITDMPERVIAAEIIREKVFNFTHEEVPYSVVVVVENFKEKSGEGGKGDRGDRGDKAGEGGAGRHGIISIRAVINVERDSQKGFLGTKVYLELFVRVEKDWTRSARALKEFGY